LVKGVLGFEGKTLVLGFTLRSLAAFKVATLKAASPSFLRSALVIFLC